MACCARLAIAAADGDECIQKNVTIMGATGPLCRKTFEWAAERNCSFYGRLILKSSVCGPSNLSKLVPCVLLPVEILLLRLVSFLLVSFHDCFG